MTPYEIRVRRMFDDVLLAERRRLAELISLIVADVRLSVPADTAECWVVVNAECDARGFPSIS